MRISCNGCRILRKGCSDNCSIRPCLSWITSPEAQSNATLFLAKFYGRAGLLNLINAAPHHLRAAVFKSLLYEASGRIVNPVNGSLGLLWTGDWGRCQAAVDAVLAGSEIKDAVPDFDLQVGSKPTVIDCGECHVAKDSDVDKGSINKVTKGRARFKMSRESKVIKPIARVGSVDSDTLGSLNLQQQNSRWERSESESLFSGETVEAMLVNRDIEPEQDQMRHDDEIGADETEVDLELTLG
ncbi:hypothetical protein L6164_001744 [Bauhinia variegata]|uniref:Uncharacterized protein n=1 Tax=Bauhinia variegata TaxID=167791 RepID=A0ACB9Q9Y9_BAUVA|nr:hypothetical protein L6164_001744 [Bauhinia variegata]